MSLYWLVLSSILYAFTDAALFRAVDELDLERYSGRWHEIARLPMFFERDCESNITADYFVDGPGKLGIRNACVKKDGTVITAYGTAYQKDKSKPGELKATFASPAFQWMPFLWADYWVLLLEDNYEWALIGEPNRTYLWILSREPTLSKLIFDMLTQHVVKLGYDVSKLIVSGVIV